MCVLGKPGRDQHYVRADKSRTGLARACEVCVSSNLGSAEYGTTTPAQRVSEELLTKDLDDDRRKRRPIMLQAFYVGPIMDVDGNSRGVRYCRATYEVKWGIIAQVAWRQQESNNRQEITELNRS